MLLGSTKLLTTKGLLPVKELHKSLDTVETIDPVTGVVRELVISKLDCHPVARYTLKPHYGTATWTFDAPRPCRVGLSHGYTFDLRAGDVIKPVQVDCGYDAASWASGFMYRHDFKSPAAFDPDRYALHSDKLRGILKADTQFSTPIDLPQDSASARDKGSFVKGYLAADGNKSPLRTGTEKDFNWLVSNAIYAGVILQGSPITMRRSFKDDDRRTQFYTEHAINWTKGAEFRGFKVSEVDYEDSPYLIAYSVSYVQGGGDLTVESGWTVCSD